MAVLTLTDARTIMGRGRPWTLRLELRDPVSGIPKFWLATGRGRNEAVEIHYGRVGKWRKTITKHWIYLESKVPEKVAQGYVYVDTPFVRMNPANHNQFKQFKQSKGSASPVLQPPQTQWRCDKGGITVSVLDGTQRINVDFVDQYPAPWQKDGFQQFERTLKAFCADQGFPCNPVWVFDTHHTFQIPIGGHKLFMALVTWFQSQINPQPQLTGPYGQVVSVVCNSGVWHALDVSGVPVLKLTRQGAQDLVAEYAHIKVAGL